MVTTLSQLQQSYVGHADRAMCCNCDLHWVEFTRCEGSHTQWSHWNTSKDTGIIRYADRVQSVKQIHTYTHVCHRNTKFIVLVRKFEQLPFLIKYNTARWPPAEHTQNLCSVVCRNILMVAQSAAQGYTLGSIFECFETLQLAHNLILRENERERERESVSERVSVRLQWVSEWRRGPVLTRGGSGILVREGALGIATSLSLLARCSFLLRFLLLWV